MQPAAVGVIAGLFDFLNLDRRQLIDGLRNMRCPFWRGCCHVCSVGVKPSVPPIYPPTVARLAANRNELARSTMPVVIGVFSRLVELSRTGANRVGAVLITGVKLQLSAISYDR